MITLLGVLFALVATPNDTLSTQYPFLREVTVQAVVTYDTLSRMYFYNYSIANGISSRGNLDELILDLYRPPGSIDYDTTGLLFMRSHSAWEFHNDYPRHISDIVPVGLPILPGNWEGSPVYGLYPWVSFHNFKDYLHPGDHVNGIVLMSRGLPGIRQFTAVPWFEESLFFPDLEDTSVTMTIEEEDSVKEAVNYRGFTVGPWAPPLRSNPATLLDTLRSLVHRSRSLGWISSSKVAEDYMKAFGLVSVAIEHSDFTGAVAQLGLVVTRAESDRLTLLKPEAYALIRYNTQYLINRLNAR